MTSALVHAVGARTAAPEGDVPGDQTLGTLPTQAVKLRTQVDASRWGTVGTSSLTKAELRLLPLLPTQLTHREIGERLCLSRHTVKAQAQSIYRKLGVSSRGQAVQRPAIRPARGVDLMVQPTGNSLIAVYYASAVTRSQ